MMAFAAAGLVLAGCGGGGQGSVSGADGASDERDRERISTEAREVFGQSGEASGSRDANRAVEGWTIVLAAFSGDGHAEAAAGALARIRLAPGLGEARAQSRGRGTAVVIGDYASPSDTRAQRDLARIRETLLDNRAVFAGAFMAPPRSQEGAGSSSRYALSNARNEFGPGVRYTLQVAVYESPRRGEAMRAAEQAAEQLRREGEPAFFHHGATRSMVTVGAFAPGEARPFLDRAPGQTAGGGSALLWELHRRHPQNLFNGNQPLMEPGADGRRRPQASFLVEIP